MGIRMLRFRDTMLKFYHYFNFNFINTSNLFKVRRVLIVDLDAHQGNGYERDFRGNSNVYIMDVFNKWIYPWDSEAKNAIRKKVELDFFVSDEFFLKIVKR